MLINALSKLAALIIPARNKERQEALKHSLELEEQKLDLQERQVAAWEQVGKSLVLIESRQTSHETAMAAMEQRLSGSLAVAVSGLQTANTALQVVLDRVGRRRTDDGSRTRSTDASTGS